MKDRKILMKYDAYLKKSDVFTSENYKSDI